MMYNQLKALIAKNNTGAQEETSGKAKISKRVASSLSMPETIKSMVENKGEDNIDPELEKFKKRAEISKDARTLSKKDFKEKYKNFSKEDYKKIGESSNLTVEDIYNDYKTYDDDYFNKIISSKEKTIKLNEEKLAKEQIQAKEKKLQEETQRKEYEGTMSGLEQKRKAIQEKYGYDPSEKFQPVDYQQEYVKGVTSEAEKRIKEKNPVRLKGYDPKDTDQMTCAKGVCTLAANQGVDFGKFEGLYEIDEKGRKIPVQNASFREKLATSGFEEIPYAQRRPGDIASFQFAGKNAPSHMEMVLSTQGNDTRFFNNYELANDPNAPESGTSERTIMPTAEGPGRNVEEEVQNAYIYRIKPEVAKQAYLNKNPEYAKRMETFGKLQSSPEYQEYQQTLNKAEELKKKYPQFASTIKK